MTSLGRGTRALLRALAPDVTPAAGAAARRAQLAAELPVPDLRQSWLILAVLGSRFPTPDSVLDFQRRARHDGLAAALLTLPGRRTAPSAEIVEGEVIVDVHDTATLGLLTGVQRVSRAIGDDWLPRGAVLAGWTGAGRLRRVDPRAWRVHRTRGALTGPPIVPWGGWYLLPEVVSDPGRNRRIQALAEFSGARSGLVGHDVIPITTAETTGSRMAGHFAKYLAAASRMSVVASVSESSATEFRGWRAMLPAAGIAGPEIVTVPMAQVSLEPAASAHAAAENLLTTPGLPLVLCVGSHEPRKNHAAVLQAAELLWSEGLAFSLVFVGGNAWGSGDLVTRIAALRAAGLPVASHRGLGDDELGWAYRLASLTVFPSLNEGFGLPVVESLLAGTPVITSRFGSTAEIAAEGGCLMVDPRDDRAIADGIRTFLTDDTTRLRLVGEAVARRARPWRVYAAQLWETLIQ